MANEETANPSPYVHLSRVVSRTGLTTSISLDDDALEAPQPFPNPRARVEFYKTFKHQADEYDGGFVKRYDDQATIALIFVSSPLHPGGSWRQN